MSRQNLAAPLMGAAALLGGGVYYARKPSNTSGDPSQQIANTDKPRPTSDDTNTEARKRAADAKRDNGLGGAGVGMNNATGGAELSTGNRNGTSADRDSPKGPSEKFPSDAGEIGGGYGRGNSNTRAIESHGPSMSPGSSTATGAAGGGKSSSSGGGSDASSSNSSGIGSKLQGFFGTGGKQEGDKLRQAPVDTKIASNHADTPTNRGGSPWEKHRKDVTSVSSTET